MARRNTQNSRMKARQVFGKYRILRCISTGGFATVYAAVDRIEGTRVAIKVPHSSLLDDDGLKLFRREIRLTAQLDHPNILPLKTADFIDDHLVIVTRLGEQSLQDRLRYRISLEKILDYSGQMLEAMAYAHGQRVVHCDLKPDNMILFPDNRLRVTDFGIARVMQRTRMSASGSGTLGYIAPEQAMGRASFRSDVFSLGLVMWHMLGRVVPKWPFEWPLEGHAEVRRKSHPEMVALLRRALEIDDRKRFSDARWMLRRFREIEAPVLRHARRRRRRRKGGT